jgi:protease-4
MKSGHQQHKSSPLLAVAAGALVFTLGLYPAASIAGDFTPYEARTEFLPQSPGGARAGLYGYVNPAMLTYVDEMESVFTWSDETAIAGAANDWGLYTGLPHLGFGMADRAVPTGGEGYREYRLALAGGDRTHGVGLAYGWANGGTWLVRPPNVFVIGSLIRPSPSLSIGLTLTSTPSASAREGAADLSLRPLADDRLTLFGTAAASNDRAGGERFWRTGATLTPLPGLSVSAGYRDDGTVTAGVHVNLGSLDLWTQTLRDRSSSVPGGAQRTRQTYAIRLGGQRANLLAPLTPSPARYLDIDLNGPLNHRRFPLFDQSRTLANLLVTIRQAQDDPDISGIAINTSGMRINWEKTWEVRRALKEFRQTGKQVVVFADRLDLRGYHFASVADRLVLDPTGMVILEGFVAGQTYYSSALEKIGVGVEEWRYFKYKSAFEPLTREQMSEADREQWQALLDDFYALARDEIIAERPLTGAQYDELINQTVVLLPSEALAHGLVDTLGRPEDLESIIEASVGSSPLMIADHSYRPLARDEWGEPPRIAVIYALGICAMDSGIRARTLVKDIETAVEDQHVKAIVLRVDSPGGDALASDRVAEALRQGRDHKPFVVSQGSVAASGGYWLSMYGDAVVAAPNTITGSIGVIGGWIYNQGLKEKLALSTDHVQVGRHADVSFGMSLPLIGVQLPDRNLNQAEMARAEHVIRTTYDQFVGKVADGRQRTREEIDEIAQGRVWSGVQALEIGLVDQLGGLDVAIDVAKQKAGIEGVPTNIVEYPRLGLFDADLLRPQLLGIGARVPDQLEATNSASDYLRFRIEHNGEPLLLMPMDQALRLGN